MGQHHHDQNDHRQGDRMQLFKEPHARKDHRDRLQNGNDLRQQEDHKIGRDKLWQRDHGEGDARNRLIRPAPVVARGDQAQRNGQGHSDAASAGR